MSKFVDELIKDLIDQPETFRDYHGQGVVRHDVMIQGYGNTRVLSVIDVIVCEKPIPTSYVDKWRLEVAVQKWYKNASLSMLY